MVTMVKKKTSLLQTTRRNKHAILCFDIETTGLDATKCKVTVVCTEDFVTGTRHCFEFARYPDQHDELREELGVLLDEARSLCGFNAVRFDIPFLVTALKYSETRRVEWSVKTSDILEQSRHSFKSTFSLNLLCQSNDIPVKISDGCQAIVMAREERWEELNDYCAMDVSILCDMYRKRLVRHPRNGRIMDLKDFCRQGLYEEQPDFNKYLTGLGWNADKRARVKHCFSEIYQAFPQYFTEHHDRPAHMRHVERQPYIEKELCDRQWTENGMVLTENELSASYAQYANERQDITN